MVGVARRGRELRVAEHGADLVEGRAGVGQGGGERVAQVVDAQLRRQARGQLGPLPGPAQVLQRAPRPAVAGEDVRAVAGPAQELLAHDVRGDRRQRDVPDPAVLRPWHGEQEPVEVDVLPPRHQDLLLARAGDHQQRQRRRGVPGRLGVERVHQRRGVAAVEQLPPQRQVQHAAQGGEVAVDAGVGQPLGDQPAAQRGHVLLGDRVERPAAEGGQDAAAQVGLDVAGAAQALLHVRQVAVAGEVGEGRHGAQLRGCGRRRSGSRRW